MKLTARGRVLVAAAGAIACALAINGLTSLRYTDSDVPAPGENTAAGAVRPGPSHESTSVAQTSGLLATCGDNDDPCRVPPCTATAHTFPCVPTSGVEPTLPPYYVYWGTYDGHDDCWANVGDTTYVVCADGFREST